MDFDRTLDGVALAMTEWDPALMTNVDRLRQAFRSSLGLSDDVAVDMLEYRGIERWDSLAHLALVAQIEDSFNVMLDTDQVIDLGSFGKAVEILREHGVAFDD